MNVQTMKVAELRDELVSRYNLTESMVTCMNKGELQAELQAQIDKSASENKADFSVGEVDFTIDFEPEVDDAPVSMQTYVPKYGSDEWQEFVMAQFKPSELFEGCPKGSALRRVAQDLLGSVINAGASYVSVIQQNDSRAVTVSYKIDIAWTLDYGVNLVDISRDIPTRSFSGMADCIENSRCTFARHPAATAETKAMGRAYKNALCLNVTTVEEKMSGYSAEMPVQSDAISQQIKNMIIVKSKQLNKNPADLIKEHLKEITGGDKEKPLEHLTQEEGKKLMTVLNQYQQN